MATVAEERTFIRPDGKEKVTGAGRYTADLTLAGQLHARFRYSDHSRARIVRIDTTRAKALPGVFAVVTHEDVPDVLYGQLVKDRRLFAKEEVRYEADIVAGVAALTPELAEQAAALIDVEYEPLPALIDPEKALDEDAPLIHTDWSSYEADENLGARGQRPWALDDRQGRCGRSHGGCRRRRQEPLSGRRIAWRADRASGSRCAMAR